jgi:hypothetical protein
MGLTAAVMVVSLGSVSTPAPLRRKMPTLPEAARARIEIVAFFVKNSPLRPGVPATR